MSRLKPRPTKLPNVLRLRFADSGLEAATHEELGARRQNPNLFCTKRRKIRHPREFQSCVRSLRCRAEGFATREFQSCVGSLRCRAEGFATRHPREFHLSSK
jgi:hypothetical protein